MALEQLDIPSRVPHAARVRLRQHWDICREADRRDLLQRVASSDVMIVDVWPKLPRSPADVEDRIIDAMLKFSDPAFIDRMLRDDPLPYTPLKVVWLLQPIERQYDTISFDAADLFDSILASRSQFSVHLRTSGEENPDQVIDDTLETLERIRKYYFELHLEWMEYLKYFPSNLQRNAKNVGEVVFVRMMALELVRIYGREPDPAMLAALTEVVFDRRDGVEAETCRSRWRAFLDDRPMVRSFVKNHISR